MRAKSVFSAIALFATTKQWKIGTTNSKCIDYGGNSPDLRIWGPLAGISRGEMAIKVMYMSGDVILKSCSQRRKRKQRLSPRSVAVGDTGPQTALGGWLAGDVT
uniref:Uncharacterized protein n=1 Tax=Candidozyma auris TaxID=498019 RepID=A0A0L0NT19_CANAR